LAVYDGADNLLMRFVYADARMPVAMSRDGGTYYLFYDQVGSLKLVADAEGNVVKRVGYDSFGHILSDSNPTFRVPFGFAGGLYDPDTGLVRFGFRDYDPDVGRWTAKDPILFAGGDTDLYGYCLNDPVSYIDPTGRVLQALLPALYFLAAKAGAMAVAYGGFKLAEQGVKLAANACPEARINEKGMSEAIDRAFVITGAINAGEVLAFGAVNAAVEYQALSVAVLSNPAAIQSSADFIQGALQPGPPPPTIPGYAGAGSRYLYDTLISQSIRKYE
jgi:RHS repeat-associated protein